MERHESTIFDFTKDKDNQLLLTSHEESSLNPSISIHCASNGGYGDFTMYITQGQAENLMRKLQEGIINLKIYKKTAHDVPF